MSASQPTPRWHGPTSRPIRRGRQLGVIVALLAALAMTALLTAGLLSVVRPILTQIYVTDPTATAIEAATQEAALTPTSADWYTVKVSGGGFQVDVPGVIGSSHGYFINDFSGQGSDLYYTGAPLSTALQRREAQVWVKILYSTRITDDNICPQGGVPMKIGPAGLQTPAWVRDEGRVVVVNLVLNGTAIEIALDSRDDTQPALMDYGDIWRHMLTSFAPLPSVQRRTTRPCG